MKHAALAFTVACGLVTTGAMAADYKPIIIPAEFSTTINNPLFNLPVGKLMVYEAKTDEGLERVEIRIRQETRKIMGVETVVYNDRVFVDNQLVEETNDYLAQHKDASVWYFGEVVDNYKDGKFLNHKGGWIAALRAGPAPAFPPSAV